MKMMKKYAAIVFSLMFPVTACSDNNPAEGPQTAGEPVPMTVSTEEVKIDRSDPEAQALSLSWDASPEAKAVQIEFSLSDAFEKPVRDIGGATGQTYTNDELAVLMLSLGVPVEESTEVFLRTRFIGSPAYGIRSTEAHTLKVTLGKAPAGIFLVNADEAGQPGRRVLGMLYSLQNSSIYSGYVNSEQSNKNGFFRTADNAFYGAPEGSAGSYSLVDAAYRNISFPQPDGCYLATVDLEKRIWSASLVEGISFEYDGKTVEMDYSPTQNAWLTSIELKNPSAVEIEAEMKLKTYDADHSGLSPLEEKRTLSFSVSAAEAGQKLLTLAMGGIRPEAALTDNTSEKGTFASGGDISWMLEKYEKWGRKFYNGKGEETECTALMKELGMNAIRLRVWVENPTENPYGWNTLPDVLEKAKRVRDLGMRLMIDFHYSDNWADPGQQRVPSAWASLTEWNQRVEAVRNHTVKVLSELKRNNIDVEWVQIGNETKNGMLWNWGAGSGSMGTYVGFSNAGYEAAKSVYPDVKAIVHLENGWDLGSFQWFFREFRKNGGKVDMIGMSYYPYWYNNLKDNANWPKANEAVEYNIKELSKEFGVDCMIVEIGYERSQPAESRKFLTDMFKRALKNTDGHCAGIFYWEPEAFDYVNGAMTDDARPSEALVPFGEYKTY